MNRLCPQEEELAGYLSGKLTGDEKKLIEKHLSRCSKCRELVSDAHTVLSTPDLREKFFELKRSLRRNIWLVVAGFSLAASFFLAEYFIQLITAAVLCGIKWIIDSQSTRMLITVYEAYRKEGKSPFREELSKSIKD
ncbi:MAG: hypothetical protein GF409_00650 [Candidatus Omnitrophica bacterium]|nr:hypothetical protein [Candidatus Omnitrophota bacterium]